MSVIKLTDLDLKGKRVLIRCDLNVPIKEGKVTSDARIKASMPTIEHCLKAGAKVMVMSHLGRPEEGVYDEAASLKPVADYMSGLLGKEVKLVKDYLDNAPSLNWRSWKTFASTRVKRKTSMSWRRNMPHCVTSL